MHQITPIKSFLYLLSVLFLFSCSAERKNIFSKSYHNTTARYNAYYYAKKRVNEIEAILKDNIDNDFNHILRIYPKIDTTIANTYQEQIEDAIKKASIAIQRHKNSKWVDDSYIYIGRSRYLSLDYVNAIDTYKYVNTKSEDDDARHEALARLIRVFVDAQEYENATAVEDYIKKESLNKDNQKILYLNKAHHYQVLEDYDKMLENLVKAAPLLKKKDGKGRIYFIIGQIYQRLDFDAEAFNYYKKCLASNPEYELDFYTRLNMAQVTSLGKTSDVKAARKLLSSLLSDAKNKEFKDKIYYEMGEFEFKQNNINQALEYYQSSVKSSVSNPRQKGQSYLRMGEVYYDSLKNFELAQAYYDSTVQSLPTDYENIEKITERKDILAEFVKQLKTITLQDSLLALAVLDTATVRKKLNGIIGNERAAEEEKQKKKEQQERRMSFNSLDAPLGISGTNWYFGNPSAVAQGQTEFTQIWGNRPLEDNWRRSNKSSRVIQMRSNTSVVENIETVKVNMDSLNAVAKDNRYNELYAAIPFDDRAKQEALNQIEKAHYQLGNIYKFQLDEDINAIATFEELCRRFPKTEYLAEVWYQLYLMYKSLGDNRHLKYEQLLTSTFPKSIYAKLIENPNYAEESTAANEQLKIVYKNAYNLYRADRLDTAKYIIDNALKEFEETVFSANLKLLNILITGKLEDITVYQYELGEFIKAYPNHEITPYAETLLESSKSFLERKRKRLGTQYVKYLEQSHYFVLSYEINSKLGDKLSKIVSEYNKGVNYQLNISNLVLDEDVAILLISDFNDKVQALNYMNNFIKEDPIEEATLDSKFHKFVITKDNFNLFYQSKDIGNYLSFFEKNYLNAVN